MDRTVHKDLRGYGTLWGSEYNYHQFLPARSESAKGSVSGADALTTGREPQTRLYVESREIGNQSQVLTMEGQGAEIILDYGVSVAGVPFFEVTACDEVELQVFFSEARQYLDSPSGDGPISFVSGPATYRNPILRPTKGSNYLVETHGAQRWQKLVLLTPGRLSISTLGFIATISSLHPTELPGYFSCSNPEYNALWDASVRTIQLCTVQAGCTPPLWKVTTCGALMQGQRAVKYQKGYRWSNYTLEFDVIVHRKNFGFVVGGTAGHGYTIYLHSPGYLRAGRPESERFQSASYSVVWGYVDENAVSVENTYLQSGLLPFELHLGSNLRVTTVLDASGIAVTINNDLAFRLSSHLFQKSVFTSSTSTTPMGTIGFGPGPDGLATFSKVGVTSNLDGSVLYDSLLNCESDLDDYFAGTVKVPCLLDGGKRDRLVWGGDAAIMGPSVAYSTNALDSLKGTIDILLSVSKADGAFAAFCPPNMPPGPGGIGERADGQGYHYSAAYELYMIQTISDAVLFGAMSEEELRTIWPLIVKQLERILVFVDDTDLIMLSEKDVMLAMDFNYYDPPRIGYSTKLNCQFVLSLKQAISLGLLINEETRKYSVWVDKITAAINSRLWNPDLGVYGITAASMDVVAQDANVFAILSGVADAGAHTDLIFDTLAEQLKHPLGLLAFNRASGYRESLSTFISGWHLEAAFQKGRLDHANLILDKILCPLADSQNPDYSGSMWELVLSNGDPGMGAYTSMAHGWAAVAASAMSRYIVGLQPGRPNWSMVRIAPQPSGLRQAEAYVSTPNGRVRVAWMDNDAEFDLTVEIPDGLEYELILPYSGEMRVADRKGVLRRIVIK